jgi:hypothetical protein
MRKANRRAHREPSKRSLREIPEVDFRTVRVKRNPYARRIAAGGLVVQVDAGDRSGSSSRVEQRRGRCGFQTRSGYCSNSAPGPRGSPSTLHFARPSSNGLATRHKLLRRA